MQKIDGAQIAKELLEKLKASPAPKKILAAILIGNNPASISFLKRKEETAKELGVDFRLYQFPETITHDEARKEVGHIANMKRVGGILVQLPLPAHLSKHYVLNAIPREKDVDVLGERALGAFYTNRNPILPPSVATLVEILNHLNSLALHATRYTLHDCKVAIVGLGFLIGKPIAHYLMSKCKELYLLDKESDLAIIKEADLVITGVGKPNLITPDMIKKDAIVIDFGYSMHETHNAKHETSEKRIAGDFSPNSHSPLAICYTPVPGGTGPILVVKLFENFYTLNKKTS